MTFCHTSGKCEYKMQEMGKSYSYIHIFFISLSYYFPVYFVDLSLSFPCYHYYHYILIMITWWKSVSICFVISVLVLNIFFITLNHDLHLPSLAIHHYFHHHCLFFLYDTISSRQDDLPWWEKQELTRVSLLCYLYFIQFIHFTYYHLRDFFFFSFFYCWF